MLPGSKQPKWRTVMTKKTQMPLQTSRRKQSRIRYPLLLLFGLLVVAGAAQSEIVGSQRTVLQDDIVHYTFDVVLGPGEFDAIRLHRVIRERRPHRPVATVDGVFLLTGTQNTFEMIFAEPLISSAVPWDQSVAVFLAKNDIDVWGMDFAWALVPPGTSDFGFMESWGLQREIDSVKEGLAAARSVRVATGQGNRRLHLLGFSYGVPIAYAIAGEETLLPPGQRHVKGLVAVDSELKPNDEARRLAACANADNREAQIAGGNFVDDTGVLLKLVGDLAKFFPDDSSPIAPLFGLPQGLLTNWQFALFLGALHDPWHFAGGEFNPFGIPIGLRFTDPRLWVDLIRAAPPFMPLRALLDLAKTRCGQVDVPFDDHLAAIALPILGVGAAGGAAPYHYTASLTASRDVETFTVQLLSNAERPFDFGHGDLFTATDAEALVWQPLLDWLIDHRSNNAYLPQGSEAGGSQLAVSRPLAPAADKPSTQDLPRRGGSGLVDAPRRTPRRPAAQVARDR
jgi:hypothetical protein